MSDNVKHPSHYCKDGIECIDAIKAIVSTIADPFEAYCTGNIVKYVWRWNSKNGIEDLHKAIQYIDFIEQYRAAKSETPIPITDNPAELTQEIREELFAEVKPEADKYADVSDRELAEVCCNLDSFCNAASKWGNRKHLCPLYDGGACLMDEVDLKAKRPELIAYIESELEAHDKKEGES